MKAKNKITKRVFKGAVGRDPVDDELEKCNCPRAGEIGHLTCGWCYDCNLPMSMCRCCNFGD